MRSSRWDKDSQTSYRGKSSMENPNSDYNCRKRFRLIKKIESAINEFDVKKWELDSKCLGEIEIIDEEEED